MGVRCEGGAKGSLYLRLRGVVQDGRRCRGIRGAGGRDGKARVAPFEGGGGGGGGAKAPGGGGGGGGGGGVETDLWRRWRGGREFGTETSVDVVGRMRATDAIEQVALLDGALLRRVETPRERYVRGRGGSRTTDGAFRLGQCARQAACEVAM